jgi:hypothetical protein
VRIIHLEDEWPKTRSIAHRVHDEVFESLPPEEAVDLELIEKEDAGNTIPSTITVSLKRKGRKLEFEYILVIDLVTLKSLAKADDVVVVDIMRNDTKGRFVSILPDILSIYKDGEVIKDNWRYFSAYPENVPEGCELKGFTKKEDDKLVEFLFDKVREQWSK